jgi:hypothetical protein
MTEDGGLNFLRILNAENCPAATQFAAVACLAAGFGVERRAIKYHYAQCALGQIFNRYAVLVQRQHRGLRFQRGITLKIGRCTGIVDFRGHGELCLRHAPVLFCRFIAASNATASTVTLRSRQMSAVKSSGNP